MTWPHPFRKLADRLRRRRPGRPIRTPYRTRLEVERLEREDTPGGVPGWQQATGLPLGKTPEQLLRCSPTAK